MLGSMKILGLCAVLSASAHAVQWNVVVESRGLARRQDSYQAPETTKPGENCTEAFGEGYETCRPASDNEVRLCYNPNLGQVCCQNEWGCPSESFCMVDGLCCPNHIGAQTCADTYGITLPSSLKTAGSGPAPTSKSGTTFLSTTIYSTPTKTISLSSTSTSNYSASSYTKEVTMSASTGSTALVYSTASVVPYPVGNSTSNVAPTGTGHATGTISSPVNPTYSGAAGSVSIVGGNTIAGFGVACILAMLGVF